MNSIMFSPIKLSLLETLIEKSVKRALNEAQILHSEDTESKLLTVDEAAEFLSLAKPTIYSYISKGTIPHMKRGKRVYFSKDELLEYIKAGKVKTKKELSDEAAHYMTHKKSC